MRFMLDTESLSASTRCSRLKPRCRRFSAMMEPSPPMSMTVMLWLFAIRRIASSPRASTPRLNCPSSSAKGSAPPHEQDPYRVRGNRSAATGQVISAEMGQIFPLLQIQILASYSLWDRTMLP